MLCFRLRYVGVNDDPSNIYWLDPAIHKVHRLGWCKDNGKPLIPPRSVSDASIAENPEEYLKGAETLSEEITGVRVLTLLMFCLQRGLS